MNTSVSNFGLLFMMLFSISFFGYSQDTIELNNVLIGKNFKKPKLKRVNVGTQEQIHMSALLFFSEHPVFYLTDKLPFGHIQNIKLFFGQIALKNDHTNYKAYKTEKTEFEVTIYQVNDDYLPDAKINSEPISIVLEESENSRIRSIEIDLSSYNLETNKFYIHLNKVTNTECELCHYYTPILYRTGNYYNYISKTVSDLRTPVDKCRDCLGLQMVVKTITQDY